MVDLPSTPPLFSVIAAMSRWNNGFSASPVCACSWGSLLLSLFLLLIALFWPSSWGSIVELFDGLW